MVAEEGAMGAGLLFVIQDSDNLIVKTNIREMDVASVNLGDTVDIRTDATGNAVFAGILTRIAPTSTQMAYGSNRYNAGAEFESEITVLYGSGLRIGMNARLSIVTQHSGNVFAVPVQAVTTGEPGEDVIFIAMPGENGYLAEAVAVTTGMETDRYIEVSAPALTEGVLVIRNAQGIQTGMVVTPS